jgi:hypothetical protein
MTSLARGYLESARRVALRFWRRKEGGWVADDYSRGLIDGQRITFGSILKMLRDIRRADDGWQRPYSN